VHSHRQESSTAFIEFSVTLDESAAVLERAALGANVPSYPPSRQALSIGRHTFAASTEVRDTFAAGNLQLLGAHLTWYLQNLGCLPTEEANLWLDRWGAVRALA
jgi:hypothetical protein